jgi:hypothetical protein
VASRPGGCPEDGRRNGLVELHGGDWGVTNDTSGPGKTVYAELTVPVDGS